MNPLHRPLLFLLSLLSVAITTTRLEADPTGLPYKLMPDSLPATFVPISGTFDKDMATFGSSEAEVREMATDPDFTYFTMDGDPHSMQDFAGAGLTFGNHLLDADIEILLVGNSGGGTSLQGSIEDVAPGLPMENFLAGISLKPAGVNDMHLGALVKHATKATMGLMALAGLGALVLAAATWLPRSRLMIKSPTTETRPFRTPLKFYDSKCVQV